MVGVEFRLRRHVDEGPHAVQGWGVDPGERDLDPLARDLGVAHHPVPVLLGEAALGSLVTVVPLNPRATGTRGFLWI